MSLSHLCPRCGAWHAISTPCDPATVAGRASGAARPGGAAAMPLAGRTPAVAAQTEADAAEARSIATYLRRGGGFNP